MNTSITIGGVAGVVFPGAAHHLNGTGTQLGIELKNEIARDAEDMLETIILQSLDQVFANRRADLGRGLRPPQGRFPGGHAAVPDEQVGDQRVNKGLLFFGEELQGASETSGRTLRFVGKSRFWG
jgi:hypothetical protein